MNEINEIVVSSAQIAEMLDLSEPRVRQLAQAGVLVRESRGRYRLAASVRGYVAHREAEMTAPEKQRREAQAQREHERWLRETQVAEGTLVSAAQHILVVDAVSLARDKAVQSAERALVDALWPRGIKDLALVNDACFRIDKSFCDWFRAALWAIDHGADEHALREIFGAASSPPAPPFAIPSSRSIRRRKAKADD
jgi:hypothetical protein